MYKLTDAGNLRIRSRTSLKAEETYIYIVLFCFSASEFRRTQHNDIQAVQKDKNNTMFMLIQISAFPKFQIVSQHSTKDHIYQ